MRVRRRNLAGTGAAPGSFDRRGGRGAKFLRSGLFQTEAPSEAEQGRGAFPFWCWTAGGEAEDGMARAA